MSSSGDAERMTIGNMTVGIMTEEYVREIGGWKYEGIYDFYSHSEDKMDGFMDGNHFVCLSEGNLEGYFCFGEDARIPTVEQNVFEEGCLDIGLGMKPELCGRGQGLEFMKLGLDFAAGQYGASRFRLSVAVFNERAIKVYKRAGFETAREVTNSYSGNKFYVMTMDKRGG